MRRIDFDELPALVGEDLGVSEWHTIAQDQIDTFASCTGDHQWIHVDRERAATGPYGTTIAHGYLTLALVPVLLHEIWELDGVALGINYGLNKVRFLTPVPSGGRVRGRGKLLGVETKADGRCQVTSQLTIELEGSEKPAVVADTIGLYVPAAAPVDA